MMPQNEWDALWVDVEAKSTPEIIDEPAREAREAREAARLRCVLCHGTQYLSIVWSVSFGELPEKAEQVIVCGACRQMCEVCYQARVTDEVHKGVCDRCRIIDHLENDRYVTLPSWRAELARWDGAEGQVAYEGPRLLEDLKRSERELVKSQKGGGQ